MTLGVVHYVSSNKLAWHGAHSNVLMKVDHTEDTSEYGFVKRTPSLKGPSTYNWEYFGRLSFFAELCVYVWQLLSIGKLFSIFIKVY